MNIVVDIGNTFTKVGFFEGNKLLKKYTADSIEEAVGLLESNNVQNLTIASVKGVSGIISDTLKYKNLIVVDENTALPINNLYRSPKTLGVDRIAGAIGARIMCPEDNCMVIDIGTCITYDYIDNENNYHGGGISPGLDMKLKALHTFTAELPLVQFTENEPPAIIGQTTGDSILSGVINGTIAEINGMIELYRKKLGALTVLLSGGGVEFFEKRLKGPIFAAPDLVLIGLNGISEHHVSN